MSAEQPAAPEAYEALEVEVIASPRRTKSVQARLVQGRIQVRVPAAMGAAERERAVEKVVAGLRRKISSGYSDAELQRRAQHLNAA